MKLRKFLAVAAFILFPGFLAWAEETTAIVATVGEEAITTQDLVDRTRLIVMSSGLPADEETARKIAPQVLQSLINEKLELQEAQKLKFEVSDEDISKAIAGLEKQNKIEPGKLKELLAKAHITYSTLQQQVRGQIAWAKIRNRRIQPKIIITDEEVDDTIKAQNLDVSQQEYFINEIVLPVENAKDEVKIKELADKLATELKSGKAEFKNIAKQFSQSSTAQNNGEVGWLTENQIPKELLAEIKKTGTSKIIGPVKSVEGYFIILASDSRKADANAGQNIVSLRQFELLLAGETSPAGVKKKIDAVNDVEAACADSESYATAKNVMAHDYGSLPINQLQPAVRQAVINLPARSFSEPFNTGASLIKFLVCAKTINPSGAASEEQRNKIRELLFRHKTELEARKYLRDLRRNTNVEIKI